MSQKLVSQPTDVMNKPKAVRVNNNGGIQSQVSTKALKKAEKALNLTAPTTRKYIPYTPLTTTGNRMQVGYVPRPKGSNATEGLDHSRVQTQLERQLK